MAEIITPGPLEQIGRAMRDQLEVAFPPDKFTHAWMPGKVTKPIWQQLTRRTPFAGIGFNGYRHVETTSNLTVISAWSIYLVTRNEGGVDKVLFGDKFAPGFFALAEVGGAVLHGVTLPGLGTIQVTEAANVYIEGEDDPSLAFALIECTVRTDLSVANVLTGEGASPDVLRAQVITWNFDGATATDTLTTGAT